MAKVTDDVTSSFYDRTFILVDARYASVLFNFVNLKVTKPEQVFRNSILTVLVFVFHEVIRAEGVSPLIRLLGYILGWVKGQLTRDHSR